MVHNKQPTEAMHPFYLITLITLMHWRIGTTSPNPIVDAGYVDAGDYNYED
jgi:hypothetical protein